MEAVGAGDSDNLGDLDTDGRH